MKLIRSCVLAVSLLGLLVLPAGRPAEGAQGYAFTDGCSSDVQAVMKSALRRGRRWSPTRAADGSTP